MIGDVETTAAHDALPSELALNVEYVEPDLLHAAGRRLRSHSKKHVGQIALSIDEFEFLSPILTDDGLGVLVGHGRLEAAKLLGLKTVPVIRLSHLSPVQKRAFVIAEQRLAELSVWNKEALAAELKELIELDDAFDLTITGFEAPEIDALVLSIGEDEADEALPIIKGPAVSRRGDVWLLGPHRLMCGDSTCRADVDRLLGGQRARLVLEDPPYNVKVAGHITGAGRHGEFVQASGEMSDQEFTGFLTQVLGESSSAVDDGALIYVFMDWAHVAHLVDAARANGLKQVNLCVWCKDAAGMGSFYRSQHELCFVFRKGEISHLNNIQLGKNGRSRTNVWSYPGTAGFGGDKVAAREMHPTVKPVAMFKDVIADCTRRGDPVLDLFSGSGTTLIACERTGRLARVMELDPHYADVAVRRWEALTGVKARLDGLALTFEQAAASRASESEEDPALSTPPVRLRARRTARGS